MSDPMERVHEVLYEHTGENAPTAKDPVAPWHGQADLTATKTVCRSWDDDGFTTVTRYEVRTVTLPAWLGLEEWLRDRVAWKFLWGMGAPREWPEQWQRRLLRLSTEEQYALAQLLNTGTFRSTFRASLRFQVVQWLDDPEPRYARPLSPRQWAALMNGHVALAAKRRSTAVYSAR